MSCTFTPFATIGNRGTHEQSKLDFLSETGAAAWNSNIYHPPSGTYDDINLMLIPLVIDEALLRNRLQRLKERFHFVLSQCLQKSVAGLQVSVSTSLISLLTLYAPLDAGSPH